MTALCLTSYPSVHNLPHHSVLCSQGAVSLTNVQSTESEGTVRISIKSISHGHLRRRCRTYFHVYPPGIHFFPCDVRHLCRRMQQINVTFAVRHAEATRADKRWGQRRCNRDAVNTLTDGSRRFITGDAGENKSNVATDYVLAGLKWPPEG